MQVKTSHNVPGERTSLAKICFTCICLFINVLFFIPPALSSTQRENNNSKIISMGVIPQFSAKKIMRMWRPLAKYIKLETGLLIDIQAAPSIFEFERRLQQGEYDIAYANPYLYVRAHEWQGYMAFAREQDKMLKGLIVTSISSQIQSIRDLQGRTIVLPSNAFAANQLVIAELKQQGISTINTFVRIHDHVYGGISQGLYSAGGGVLRTLNSMDRGIQRQLKVIYETKSYTPHAMAYHPRLSKLKLSLVEHTLLGLGESKKTKKILNNLFIKGFTQAKDADWNDVRELSF